MAARKPAFITESRIYNVGAGIARPQSYNMKLPKRKNNRLSDFDYSLPHAYFITICTDKRRNLFWRKLGKTEVCFEGDPLSENGKKIRQVITEVAQHYPAVSVDKYVIMPNHVHLLLRINTDCDGRPMAAPTISTLVNQMKGAATKQIGFPIWQKGFYDHVIRSNDDYRDIWNYIEANPFRWYEDELYSNAE